MSRQPALPYFSWQNEGWKWTILLLLYAKINTKEGKGLSQQKDAAKESNKYEIGEQIYFENYRMLLTIWAPRLWNNFPTNVGKGNFLSCKCSQVIMKGDSTSKLFSTLANTTIRFEDTIPNVSVYWSRGFSSFWGMFMTRFCCSLLHSQVFAVWSAWGFN